MQSIQDQQDQTLNLHDSGHARDGKHYGFPRFVVTGKPLDLHVQRPMIKILASVTPRGDEGDGASRPRSQTELQMQDGWMLFPDRLQ